MNTTMLGLLLSAIAMAVTIRVISGLARFDPTLKSLNQLAWLVAAVMVLTSLNCLVFTLLGYDFIASQPSEWALIIRTVIISLTGWKLNQFLREYSEKKGDEKLSEK